MSARARPGAGFSFRRPAAPPTWGRAAPTAEAGTAESLLVIEGARPIYLDRGAVAADIPGLADAGTAALKAWLARRCAVISEAQAAPNAVNDPAPLGGGRRRGLRPPRYGRAVLLETDHGFVDVKGIGVKPGAAPLPNAHGDGLLTCRDAFRELAWQAIVDRALGCAGAPFATLPVYAILDLGFDRRGPGGRRARLGAIVRRAHRRCPASDLPAFASRAQGVCMEIEMILRCFGITSARGRPMSVAAKGAWVELGFGGQRARIDPLLFAQFAGADRLALPARIDRINVQVTDEVEQEPDRALLYDFEHYEFRDSFDLPVLSHVRNRRFGWGGVLTPDMSGFVRGPDFPLVGPPSVGARAGGGRRTHAGNARIDAWARSLERESRAEGADAERLAARLGAMIESLAWPAPCAMRGGRLS